MQPFDKGSFYAECHQKSARTKQNTKKPIRIPPEICQNSTRNRLEFNQKSIITHPKLQNLPEFHQTRNPPEIPRKVNQNSTRSSRNTPETHQKITKVHQNSTKIHLLRLFADLCCLVISVLEAVGMPNTKPTLRVRKILTV